MTNLDTQSESEELAQRFAKVFEATFKHLSRHQSLPFNPMFRELNGNQFLALSLLQKTPGMVQKDLAEQMKITPAAISTAVRHMERCGLIQRIPDTNDARLMRLYLSENTGQMMQQMQEQRLRGITNLLQGLPLSEQRMVVEALERALAARQQAEIEQTA